MTFEKRLEISRKLEKYLRDNRLYCNVEPYAEDIPVVEVEISWGDWKHEHLRAKWLISELGGHLVKSAVTEENGSDCYSAIHWFLVSEDMFEKGVA